MSEILIVNASPLIFLGNAGRLDLLRTIDANRIIVPEPVFDEVIAGGHSDAAAAAVSEAVWLERRASPAIPVSVASWDLGEGESAVIALAIHTPGARVVIDDLSGRRCSLAHGIDTVGTLGVIITAHRRGQLPNPREVLLELRAAGMWLSDDVIARTLSIARIDP